MCIFDGKFVIQEKDIKLGCKFISFSNNETDIQNNYIYFNNVQSVTNIYSLKVTKIHAQFP